MARRNSLTWLAAGIVLVACADAAPLLAPADQLMPPQDVQLTAQPAASNGGYGARVYRETQDCFLPGIGADGSVIPLLDVPCEVQLVLTNNGRNIANGWIRATVPNESGRAVRMTFGNPAPIPCVIWIEETDEEHVTEQYNLIISASGRLTLSCRFRDP